LADNIAITAGTGTSVAADDIGSVFYQRVKLSLGADGAAVDAIAGAGNVGTGVQRVTLAADDPGVAARGGMDDWDRTDACKVVGTTVLKSIALTADTSIMANADIIADTQQLDGAFRIADGTGVLQSIAVFDPDDNTPFTFYIGIHRTSTSLGSENGGITISDANAAAGIIHFVSFATTDCIDLINGRMYQKSNLGIPIHAVSGTDDLYVSMVCLVGTPTFAGGAVTVVLGILQD
jgi:hypothetical protein